MELVWTRDGKRHDDTIHRAGCQHIHLADPREVNTLAATTPDAGAREVAECMGWHDYPDDANEVGFIIHVAPCVR